MGKKRRYEGEYEPRWTAGLREYRYGEMHIGARTYDLKSRITLAGPKPKPIFRGEKRKNVVAEAMNVMRDWRLSPFEHEGATRAGLRSSLCLDGYDWNRADGAAADIVKECLHRMGAERPTYLKGQREYTIPREFCRCCLGPLDDEALAARRAFCSEECRQSVRTRDTMLYERLMVDTRNRASFIKANAAAAPRSCSQCGKTYRAAKASQMVCSRECAQQALRTIKPRNCLWCQKTFRPRDNSKRCCSVECGVKHGAMIRNKAAPEVICAVCKSVFRKRSPMGKYCSPSCKTWADNEARRLPERTGNCEECGAEFVRQRSDKLYCSRACGARAGARRRAESVRTSAYFCETAE